MPVVSPPQAAAASNPARMQADNRVRVNGDTGDVPTEPPRLEFVFMASVPRELG
jgi:hypothetical protein